MVKKEITIQSDWNQEDETEKDFIKNKPSNGNCKIKILKNTIINNYTG
jgi:hypothetical protein